MIIICITDVHGREEFIAGNTLAEAAQKAVEDRVGNVTDIEVIPRGGTLRHIVLRDVDPEGFWLAHLSHSMSDNEEYGWGHSEQEAKEQAVKIDVISGD